MSLRRGDVVEWVSPAGPRRVVVLSNDEYNAAAWPICAGIVRTGTPSLYLVPLADPDPVGGLVFIGSLGAIPRHEIRGEPVGMVTGATMARIQDAIAVLLEITR